MSTQNLSQVLDFLAIAGLVSISVLRNSFVSCSFWVTFFFILHIFSMRSCSEGIHIGKECEKAYATPPPFFGIFLRCLIGSNFGIA